jgi:hypothetical protein
MSSRDEMVMDFIAATKMDFEAAISALESSGWNLQRCLDAHFSGGGGGGGGVFGGVIDDDDGVRAPIMPRTEVLAGPALLARAVRPPPTAASFNTNSFDQARITQRDFRAEGRFGGRRPMRRMPSWPSCFGRRPICSLSAHTTRPSSEPRR